MQKISLKNVFTFMVCLLALSSLALADVAVKPGKDEDNQNLLRASRGLFDLQKNTVSNIEFYVTNYGMWGLNVAQNVGSGIWPRGSFNQYIFGAGVWFGAIKKDPNNVERKYVEMTYNPNSGRSWMVPGRIDDGDKIIDDDLNAIRKYRTYFSIDFRSSDGKPITAEDGAAWPIWDASTRPNDTLKFNRYFGHYISDDGKRTTNEYPKGPAFISGEDIFSTFKDTDLEYFEGGSAKRRAEGYPLRLQFENIIYSWGFGEYRDFIFHCYTMINMSKDSLKYCWLAPVMDVDIALTQNTSAGAANDRARFYNEDTTLNLALQWTGVDRGERGRGFGYLGLDFLESPAVIRHYDTNGVETIKDDSYFVRKDSAYYSNENQLGLRTFRNWPIEVDPKDDFERYNFISAGFRDGDTGPGDKRFMMATGPFHMRPKDTVRVVVGVILANASKGMDADGTTEDVVALVEKDKFAQEVYDNNFRAPQPPDRAVIKEVTPLNNAIKITWDSTSEYSVDRYERGLDFMGYRLYRARRTNLDTFDVDEISKTAKYPSGKGAFGWKNIASWSINTPFLKSSRRGGKDPNAASVPFMDSLRIVGPYVDESGVVDSMALKVMRICRGCIMMDDKNAATLLKQDNIIPELKDKVLPIIYAIDTLPLRRPWGNYFASMVEPNSGMYIYSSRTKNDKLFKDVLIGTAYLNRALLKFNPLFYKSQTVTITPVEFAGLPADGYKYKVVDGVTTAIVEAFYNKKTYKQIDDGGNSKYTIEKWSPVSSISDIMKDSTQTNIALDSLYAYLQTSRAKIVFPEFEQSEDVRKKVIAPYMANITNNRTYIDIGDDNDDGTINYDENPAKSEKILNNVTYYYKLLSFDEGDFQQPTPVKINEAFPGLPNLTEAYALNTRVGNYSELEVVYEDKDKLGGLYNFKFFALDPERVTQLFGGHELELEFNPVWNLSELTFPGRPESEKKSYGLYQSNMKITDLTTKEVLYNGNTFYEAAPCQFELRGLFTEKSFSFVYADSVVYHTKADGTTDSSDFGTRNNRQIRTRSGKYFSGDFLNPGYCYTNSMLPPALGSLGFSFDYTIQQYGGWYRPDSLTLTTYKLPGVTATTPIGFADDPGSTNSESVLTTTNLGFTGLNMEYNPTQNQLGIYPWYDDDASFNNGPGIYELEFLPGGEEEIKVNYGDEKAKIERTFKAKYYNVKLTNKISYNRPAPEREDVDSVAVAYPLEMPHLNIPILPISNSGNLPKGMYPDPRNLYYTNNKNTNEFIGKFNMCAFGWVDGRDATSGKKLQNSYARPIGKDYEKITASIGSQGRYYLSAKAIDGNEVIDFTHLINIAGVQFIIDYANKSRISTSTEIFPRDPNFNFGEDFKVGDKLQFRTFGGALGFPMPGAKVRVKVSEGQNKDKKYTDNILDQISIVPNPYYISHQEQASPYDAKILFTRLPKQCKIEIYTITGDKVVTINHDELGSDSPAQVQIWDLLSKNGQRVSSQTFAALITTPDGAQTIKNFSVIVGGFRVFGE